MARLNAVAEVLKGIKANIHAVDNLSPVSRVAVYVKAGSRYEPDHLPGIAHYVQACAGITTRDSSAFGITRHTERHGATFKASIERDYLVYRVNCLRDRLGYVLRFIDDTLHKPQFFAWELFDLIQPRIRQQLSELRNNQPYLVNEALHKAAYRGGLAHSTIIPEFQIDKIKSKDCHEYVAKNFVLERMTFTGLGVNENDFAGLIEEKFSLNENAYGGVTGASRYIGGEARVQSHFPKTLVNLVVPGCSVTDLKTSAALEVIATLIGADEQKAVKYGSGYEKSLFAALNAADPSIKADIVNIQHADNGLFGVSIFGSNTANLKMGVQIAYNHVKSALSNISESDFKRAKQTAYARALLKSEDQDRVFKAMCVRHATGIIGQSELDLINNLTIKDVQAVANTLRAGKPSMASVGNPRYVPCLDELESGSSVANK